MSPQNDNHVTLSLTGQEKTVRALLPYSHGLLVSSACGSMLLGILVGISMMMTAIWYDAQSASKIPPPAQIPNSQGPVDAHTGPRLPARIVNARTLRRGDDATKRADEAENSYPMR